MSKNEKYWVFSMIFLLLASDSSGETLVQLIFKTSFYLVAIGYFVAMIWALVRGESK